MELRKVSTILATDFLLELKGIAHKAEFQVLFFLSQHALF